MAHSFGSRVHARVLGRTEAHGITGACSEGVVKRTAKQYTALLNDVQRFEILGILTLREAQKAFVRTVKLANASGFTVIRKGHRDYEALKVRPQ